MSRHPPQAAEDTAHEGLTRVCLTVTDKQSGNQAENDHNPLLSSPERQRFRQEKRCSLPQQAPLVDDLPFLGKPLGKQKGNMLIVGRRLEHFMIRIS